MVAARRLAILAALLGAGCATGRGMTRSSIGVEVENDLSPPVAIVVYMIGSGGRQLLGDVPPGQHRRLEFRESSPRGQYSLEADTRSERVTSAPIALRPRDVVVWQVRANLVRVRERDPRVASRPDEAG